MDTFTPFSIVVDYVLFYSSPGVNHRFILPISNSLPSFNIELSSSSLILIISFLPVFLEWNLNTGR